MNPHVSRPARVASRRFARARRALLGLAHAAAPAATNRRRSPGGTIMPGARGRPHRQPAAVDPVHRPLVPQLHPDGTRLVPPSRDRRARAAVVRAAQASLRRERRALAAAFNLTATPATIIVAPNRDIVAVHQGYLGPEELDALPARLPGAVPCHALNGTSRRRDRQPGREAEDNGRKGNESTDRRALWFLPGQPGRRTKTGQGTERVFRRAPGPDLSIRKSGEQ